jgi:hypothetical protein
MIDEQARLGADRPQVGIVIRDELRPTPESDCIRPTSRFQSAVRRASASVERLHFSSSRNRASRVMALT